MILDHRGEPIRRAVAAPAVRGRYDSAQTAEDTRRHWQESDHLSARWANSPTVRERLRNRCRYEVANNSWAAGIADALADFMVGDGPRLQVLTGDRNFNRLVEAEWCDWCEAVGLADKLWLMRRVRAVDGEAFLFFDTDEDLSPITLDVRDYEAEQVATPYGYPIGPLFVDGIELNDRRKPAFYHLLYEHPGDALAFRGLLRFETVPASQVVHWFRATRPGQYRGIPEFTHSLPLFASLRRYRDATIAAAETAADFAAVLYTELPPETAEVEGQPWEKIPVEKRMLTTVPAGWKLSQFKAEQPTTNHPDFVRICLTELATGHSTTYEIASGDYSNVNYSSGRLGQQRFHRAIEVDRCRMERNCLNRILREWLAEAVRVRLIPDLVSRSDGWTHRWLWPAMPVIDPEKDAKAQALRLQNFTTTFSEECYRDGVDPETRADEIEADVEMFDERDLPSPYPAMNAAPAAPAPQSPQTGDTGNEADQQQEPGDGPAYAARFPRNGFH